MVPSFGSRRVIVVPSFTAMAPLTPRVRTVPMPLLLLTNAEDRAAAVPALAHPEPQPPLDVLHELQVDHLHERADDPA